MASGGGVAAGRLLGSSRYTGRCTVPASQSRRSWARVVNGDKDNKNSAATTLDHKEKLEKSKSSTRDMVHVDDDFRDLAFECMQTSLFGKFLIKALPLEQLKMVLADAWTNLGEF